MTLTVQIIRLLAGRKAPVRSDRIAEELGESVTEVRTALHKLYHDGAIVAVPAVGYRLASGEDEEGSYE